MRNLLTLFCSVLVFCACASQTQSTQKADKDELNLAKLKAECEKNNAKSCYELGFTLFIGSERSGNDEKPFDAKMLNSAKSYLLKSCDLNYGDGCVFYAVTDMMSAVNDLNSSKKAELQKTFENKNFVLDNKSFMDKVIGKDKIANMIKYLQKSCNLNSSMGCDELGILYYNGEFVKKDENLGFSYRKKACDVVQLDTKFEFQNACNMKVGRAYYNGENVAKNKQLALKYFLKGCEVSPHYFCSDYVEKFYKGYNGELIKVPQDYEFAFQLAKKGCEMNDGKSCNYLGILYEEGKGTMQDLKRAFWTFQKLCYQETYGKMSYKTLGCYNLALCYANGQGVEQDYKRAFNSFKELCDKNEMSSACAITGEYYYNAKGIRQDYRKAMEYFGKACDMGEQNGCDNHKMMKQMPFRYGLKDEDFK